MKKMPAKMVYAKKPHPTSKNETIQWLRKKKKPKFNRQKEGKKMQGWCILFWQIMVVFFSGRPTQKFSICHGIPIPKSFIPLKK